MAAPPPATPATDIKSALYRSMKEHPSKYGYIQCLEIPDQVFFVQMLMSRPRSLDSLVSIRIADFHEIMSAISPNLYFRYRVFRKAYYGEHCGCAAVSDRCMETYDCLLETYGVFTDLAKSCNLLIHHNRINRVRGVRSCPYVNKAAGVDLWCDSKRID